MSRVKHRKSVSRKRGKARARVTKVMHNVVFPGGRFVAEEHISVQGGFGEENESNVIKVRQFLTQPAMVGVHLGRTINMGDYESTRVDVVVNVPAYKEEIDEAYKFAYAWAEKRIEEQVDMINKGKEVPTQ